MRSGSIVAVATFAMAILLAAPAVATDYTFYPEGFPGNRSGTWDDGGCWNPTGGPPGEGDTATIADCQWGEEYYSVTCVVETDYVAHVSGLTIVGEGA